MKRDLVSFSSLTAAEIGKTIAVTAAYVDNQGTAEAVISASTAAVTPLKLIWEPSGSLGEYGRTLSGRLKGR